VLYNSKRNCDMNGIYAIDSKELTKNRDIKVRIQMLKRP
jgi:hypothetical protein